MEAPPEMRAPGHGFVPDIDEPDTGTPNFDRLSRDATDTLVSGARSAATSKVNKEIDRLVGSGHQGCGLQAVHSGGRRMRVGGEGTQGVRMRGAGLKAVGSGRIRVTD